MNFSGSGSYFVQRGMGGSSSGLQGSPTMYPLSGANAPFQSNTGGSSMGSGLPVESSTMPARAVSVGAPTAMPQGEPVRRKRGRPRKYGPDAKVLLSLPSSSSPPATTSSPTQKRGRGRPPGTGRKQQLASIGNYSWLLCQQFMLWVNYSF